MADKGSLPASNNYAWHANAFSCKDTRLAARNKNTILHVTPNIFRTSSESCYYFFRADNGDKVKIRQYSSKDVWKLCTISVRNNLSDAVMSTLSFRIDATSSAILCFSAEAVGTEYLELTTK